MLWCCDIRIESIKEINILEAFVSVIKDLLIELNVSEETENYYLSLRVDAFCGSEKPLS